MYAQRNSQLRMYLLMPAVVASLWSNAIGLTLRRAQRYMYLHRIFWKPCFSQEGQPRAPSWGTFIHDPGSQCAEG